MKHFSNVAHPHSNGQVEVINKTIKLNLKKKLLGCKGSWVDALPGMLWAYQTTPRTATDRTYFAMTYGTKALLLVEIGVPTHRVTYFNEQRNSEGLNANLNMLEVGRDEA